MSSFAIPTAGYEPSDGTDDDQFLFTFGPSNNLDADLAASELQLPKIEHGPAIPVDVDLTAVIKALRAAEERANKAEARVRELEEELERIESYAEDRWDLD